MQVGALRKCGALLWIGAWVAVATAQTEEPASQPVSRPVVRPPTSLPSTSPATAPSGPLPRVVLEIGQSGEDWGRIVIELAQDKVPITVDNFLQYVDDGFYDGTIFHRVIPGYLIQGGGYSSLTELKKTGLRRPIRSEAKNGLKNLRGTIAMARAKIPSSATAQFFINLEDNSNLDYPGRDGWGYCAFGTVVEGLEIVDRIKDVPAQRDPASDVDRTPSQPIDPPFIKRAYRLGAENTTRPAGIAPPERELPEPPAPGAEDSGHENTPEPPPPSGPPPKPETSEPART